MNLRFYTLCLFTVCVFIFMVTKLETLKSVHIWRKLNTQTVTVNDNYSVKAKTDPDAMATSFNTYTSHIPRSLESYTHPGEETHSSEETFLSDKTSLLNERSPTPFCSSTTRPKSSLYLPPTYSASGDWTFAKRTKCPDFAIEDFPTSTFRDKYVLDCEQGDAKLVLTATNASDDIHTLTMNNTSCLSKYINRCCNDGNAVPNVVHYVWYFNNEMKFPMFVSMLSVIKFVRPCLILFHGDYVPYGKYWNFIVNIFPNIVHLKQDRYTTIFGQSIHFHEHSGDIMRIEALQTFGGIYLDTDHIVLKSLDSFRNYEATLCKQSSGLHINSLIIAKPNATFLSLWMKGYENNYRWKEYGYNSMVYSGKLARKYPSIIHVEDGTMCRPKEMVGKALNLPLIRNWSDQYAFHIFSRRINYPLDERVIRNFNTTFGAMLRHIIFGTKELCDN